MSMNTQLEYIKKGGRPMIAQQNKYIFPPRAKEAIPPEDMNLYATLGYQAQLKYNDTRTLFKLLPNDQIQLWSRHGERLKDYTLPEWLEPQFLELKERLAIDPDSWALIDGGVIDCKHKAIKDHFAIWDILVLNGNHLIDTTYQERYDLLRISCSTEETYEFKNATGIHQLGTKATDNIIVPDLIPPEKWQDTWQHIQEINKPYNQPLIEGLVFKQMQGKLTYGHQVNNNTTWMAKTRVQTGRHRY